MSEAPIWSQMSEDVLVAIFYSVAAADGAGELTFDGAPPPARGLAALALVCRHWRDVALGDALTPLWRALHWERCRHTDPPVPDLVEGLDDRCDSGGAVMTYRRRAVCSRARRTARHAPVFFQARGRADQGVLVPADTVQCVNRLRSSLAFRYLVLRFERSMPQTPEETELLSREGAYDEAMLRSYTAEGEYDSFPTVEFDRLVVEHAEPRIGVEWPEAKAKQHADWVSLFGEQPEDSPSSADGGRDGLGFRLTTEEYRYVLFDWTLHSSATKQVADAQPEPEDELAPVRPGASRADTNERLIRPSELWSNRQTVMPPAPTLSPGAPRNPAEEIGAALLFIHWKPGRLGLRHNYRYDNSSTGVRTALGIARPLDHRFVIHQSPTMPPSIGQGYSRSTSTGYSNGCSPIATVAEVDAHVRHAWTMEVDTRSFFAATAKAGGVGSSVDDHTELHAAFVRHGAGQPRNASAVGAHHRQPETQLEQEQQQSSTKDKRCWQAPLVAPLAGGTVSSQPVTQVRRADHVAELERRKVALESEIAEVRTRGRPHGS